jgi:hypothetical protein
MNDRQSLVAWAALAGIVLAAFAAAVLLLTAGSFEQRPFHIAVIGLCAGSVAHMLRARRLSWIGCCFVGACAVMALGAL